MTWLGLLTRCQLLNKTFDFLRVEVNVDQTLHLGEHCIDLLLTNRVRTEDSLLLASQFTRKNFPRLQLQQIVANTLGGFPIFRDHSGTHSRN